ncbi:MAG: tandem-95 repeat protein, partial [Candidatus Latescibacteria bacterium]|nr:tandem-95 repeat protein [Candidatus Latescibacterota bacterium]
MAKAENKPGYRGFRSVAGKVLGRVRFLAAVVLAAGFWAPLAASAATLSVSDTTIVEGSSTVNVRFRITLSAPVPQAVTVNASTADGTAKVGEDYEAWSGTLTIPANQTEIVVTLSTFGDQIDEDDETYTLNLSNPVNATIADGQGVCLILDDDNPPSLQVSDSPLRAENAGPAPFTVTLSRSSAKVVKVDYATANGTALAGSDYTAGSGTLTFNPGETTKTLQVGFIDDTLDEIDEEYLVNIANPVNATILRSQGKGKIADNDLPPAVSIGDVAVDEGSGQAVFTLTLSGPSTKTTSVRFATADGTAALTSDYTANNGTVTFAPGETSKTFSVALTDDSVDEPDETFFVNLSTAVELTIQDNQALATILDNDAVPVITIGDMAVIEGDTGVRNITFTVSIAGTSVNTVRVNYATVDGSAISTAAQGQDYEGASAQLTFLPGESSKIITLSVYGDRVDEPNIEDFYVNLSSPVNGTIGDGQARGRIIDNDGPPELVVADTTISESGTLARITVNLVPFSSYRVRVDYHTEDRSARAGSDYTPVSGVLNIAAGDSVAVISVPVNNDALDEADEVFALVLSNPDSAIFGDAEGLATLIDDDPAPALSIADLSPDEPAEGAAPLAALFAVSLSAPSGQELRVDYATANGSAVAGALQGSGDFDASSGTLVFAAGETTKTLAVNINPDGLFEGQEQFLVNLSNPVNATLADAQAQAAIRDYDLPPSISVADLSLDEGNAGTTNALFVVALSKASGQPVSVAYATNTGTADGADFSPATGVLQFAPGVTSQIVRVTINSDGIYEADEAFTLSLASPVNATFADNEATATLRNDDALPQVTIGDASLGEERAGIDALEFALTLSNPSSFPVSVALETADGTAQANSDYLPGGEVLVFAPGETSKTFRVQVVGDNSSEADETFFVNLGTPTNATLADDQGLGTIINDDTNLPPVAVADVVRTDEDAALTVDLRRNDTDADGDALAVSVGQDGQHGHAVVNGDGTVTYTPALNYNGPDSFTYTVSDGQGGSASAAVSVTVVAVNDAPVANADAATTNEDSGVLIEVRRNDTDADGDALAVSVGQDGQHGHAAVNGDGTVTYTPALNYDGPDSFTYTVSDGQGGSASAAVSVTVNPVSDAPVAVDDAGTVPEDGSLAIAVLANDSDADGDPLSISSLAQASHGSTERNGAGGINYVPNPNFYGTDSFTYTVSDGQGGSASATVTVNVTAVNDAPVAVADAASTPEDQAVSVGVLANDTDVDGPTLSVAVLSQAASGAVVRNADNSLTYTPAANFYGSDSFTYTVSDGQGGSDVGTVTVVVGSVNDLPVAVADALVIAEDSAVAVAVLANDSDVDGDGLTVTAASQPGHGAVLLAVDGGVTYTPALNYNGPDSFTYTVSDGQGGSEVGTVSVMVSPVNDAPVAANGSIQADEDVAVSGQVVAGDVDNDALSYAVARGPAHGALSLGASGAYTYT